MKAASLSITKVEFVHIKVEANSDFDGEYSSEFHQLDYSFSGIFFKRRMSLQYDTTKSEDPRNFIFGLSIMLNDEDQDLERSGGLKLPYKIDIKAVAYMRLESDRLQGFERFRGIRVTGYSVLYGAIREMVSNLTARGPNGMWSLPAADFLTAAVEEAGRDEEKRQEYLAQSKTLDRKKTVKRLKKKTE